MSLSSGCTYSPSSTIFHHQPIYTRKLIECVPRSSVRVSRLKYIPGSLPDLRRLPPGCVFEPRCEEVFEICRMKTPEFVEVKPGRFVACHRYLNKR